METIIIPAAEPIADQYPEPITIIIDDKMPLPDFNDLERAGEYYNEQAAAIEDALFNALSQGIMDRLIVRLMAHKVSLFKGLSK